MRGSNGGLVIVVLNIMHRADVIAVIVEMDAI